MHWLRPHGLICCVYGIIWRKSRPCGWPTKWLRILKLEFGKLRKGRHWAFLLQYTRDFTIAVVEAKSEDRPAGEGLQQAKEYAQVLGLKFAYSTIGHQEHADDMRRALVNLNRDPAQRFPDYVAGAGND